MYYQRPLMFRILDAFFRHWRLFVISLLTIVAVIAGYVVAQPKNFTTTYTCVLNEDTLANPLNDQAQVYDWNAVQKTVDHFQTLVETKDFDQAALASPDNPLKLNHPIDFNNPDEVAKLQKNLSIWSIGTDAFSVNLIWGDPDDSVKILNALISTFVEQNAQEKSSFYSEEVAFIGRQVDDYRNKLSTAESSLSTFKGQNIDHLPTSQDAQEQSLINMQQRVKDLQLQLAEDQDRETILAQQVSITPKTIVSQQSISLSPLQTALQSLTLQLDTNLASGMKPNHPAIVALEQKIANVKAQLKSGLKSNSLDASGDAGQMIQQNPQYQYIYNELMQNRIDQKGLAAEIADTAGQIGALQSGVSKIPEEERIMSNLTRDYQFNSDNYTLLKKRLSEAVLSEQLNLRQERGMYAPYLTGPPQSSTNKTKIIMLFAGGILIALLVACGLVVASEAMDRSFRDPYDTQRALGVPVLAMLPESPDLHVADSRNPKLPGGGRKGLGRSKVPSLLPSPTSPAVAAATAAAAGHSAGNFTSPGFGSGPAAGTGGAV